MTQPNARATGRPGAVRRAWRALGSLRLGVILLVVIAVASVVGIVLPQAESFSLSDYVNRRLVPMSGGAMEPAEFVSLGGAIGARIGRESVGEFLARAKSGGFTADERSQLFPQAAVPMPDAMKMPQEEWRRAYADFVRRAGDGELTRAEQERLALVAFVQLARTRQADDACLRLSYADSYGGFLGGLLVRFQMHRVFRCFWFRIVCLLLVINLIACSSRRIPGQWRAAFGTPGGTDASWYARRSIHASTTRAGSVEETARAFSSALRSEGFRVDAVQEGDAVRLEGHRGWLGCLGHVWRPLGRLSGLGRLGANVVHCGVMLVIVGGFVSGRLSFRHGQWGQPGDVVVLPDVSYRLSPAYQLGRLWRDVGALVGRSEESEAQSPEEQAALAPEWREGAGPSPPKTAFRMRIDRFDVKFNRQGKPEYYRCHVTVLDTEPPLTYVIEVNRPLIYRGFYVYQQDVRDEYSRLGVVNFVVARLKHGGAAVEGAGFHGGEQAGTVEEGSRVAVPAVLGRDVKVPGTEVTVRVLRYFPHWQIPLRRMPDGRTVAGESRNLSGEPHNPAIEVRVSAPGQEAKVRWLPLPPPRGRERPPSPMDYGGYRLTATSFEPARTTGLSIKTHPVMLPVWLGCGVMMLGICLCFYCNHERVWVLVRGSGDGSEAFLAGNAFKWRERFRERFAAVVQKATRQSKDTTA
ncbi:cytochrome c biogenesis protein ResB [bacterium]|nr:cytochrome c biogenesis protein ResB [bacterium]